MLCGLGHIPCLLAALLFHPVKKITGAPTGSWWGKYLRTGRGREPEENLGAGAYRAMQEPVQPCSLLRGAGRQVLGPLPPEKPPQRPLGPLQGLVRPAFLLRVVGHGVPKERQKSFQGKGCPRSPPDFCLQGPSCSRVEDGPEGASVGENGQASSQQGAERTTLSCCMLGFRGDALELREEGSL